MRDGTGRHIHADPEHLWLKAVGIPLARWDGACELTEVQCDLQQLAKRGLLILQVVELEEEVSDFALFITHTLELIEQCVLAPACANVVAATSCGLKRLPESLTIAFEVAANCALLEEDGENQHTVEEAGDDGDKRKCDDHEDSEEHCFSEYYIRIT